MEGDFEEYHKILPNPPLKKEDISKNRNINIFFPPQGLSLACWWEGEVKREK
jgi:hypothetical protein